MTLNGMQEILLVDLNRRLWLADGWLREKSTNAKHTGLMPLAAACHIWASSHPLKREPGLRDEPQKQFFGCQD